MAVPPITIIGQKHSFKETTPVLVDLLKYVNAPENFGAYGPQQYSAVDKLQN